MNDQYPQVGPKATAVWALGSLLALLVLSNPSLHLLFMLASLCVVRTKSVKAVRSLLLVGIGFTLLRTVLFALTGHSGELVLVTVGKVQFPSWLGGLQLGGAISAQSIITGAAEGIRLLAVLSLFSAFFTMTDPTQLIRLMPNWLIEPGLILNIAIGFAPHLVRTAREIKEAQAMRGITTARLRSLPSSVVPTIATALEHSVSLAEAMETRGYGYVVGKTDIVQRRVAVISALLLSSMAALIAMGAGSFVAMTLLAGGTASLAFSLRKLGPMGRTSYRTHRTSGLDVVVIATAVLAFVLTLTARRYGWSSSFDPSLFQVPVPRLEEICILAVLLVCPIMFVVNRRKRESS